MLKAVEVVQKGVIRGLEKAPGWAPLLALTFVLVTQRVDGGPIDIRGLSVTLPGLNPTIWVFVITAAAYKIGDIWDDVFFKTLRRCFSTRGFTRARFDARSALMVKSGRYRVAMALAKASHQVLLPNVLNETAKFARSLTLPLFLAVVVLWGDRPGIATGFLVLSAVTGVGYAWLKVQHMRILYSRCRSITTADEYEVVELEQRVRLYFWRGDLVASAIRGRTDEDS